MKYSTESENKIMAAFETFVGGFLYSDGEEYYKLNRYDSFEEFCLLNIIEIISEEMNDNLVNGLVYYLNYPFNRQTQSFRDAIIEESTNLEELIEDLGNNEFKVEGQTFLILTSSEVEKKLYDYNKSYVEMMLDSLDENQKSFFCQFSSVILKAYNEITSTLDKGVLASYDGYMRDCGEYSAFRIS